MKKKVILFTIFLLVVGAFLSFKTFNNFKNKSEIEKILSSKDYSYLPFEAKKFVTNYYDETGIILLTEKNKVDNVPYLNPEYVKYLELSPEDQGNTSIIPDITIVDFIPSAEYDNASYPSSYDLRNVNGNNYTSALENQGSLNLCWTYATNSQLSSLALLSGLTNYDFSERQLDYVTASDGITDYQNDAYSRTLTSGGNYLMTQEVLLSGIGAVDNSKFTATEDSMELSKVKNYSNSVYELNSSIVLPGIENATNRDAYINTIKSLIVNYGGAYVSTASPTDGCSVASGSNRLIYNNNNCNKAGHALQIIGWDDNYEYSFCQSTSSTGSHSSSLSGCSSSNIIKGKGVWILKNSWGDSFAYPLLAYDSLASNIYSTISIGERSWDNYYEWTNSRYTYYHRSGSELTFTKPAESSEVIDKIKIKTISQNNTFNIFVSTTGKSTDYVQVGSVNITLPGLYTLDLSSKNIVINSSDFKIKFEATNNADSSFANIYAFTDNVSNESRAFTSDYVYERNNTLNSDYEFRILSEVRNVPSNAVVTYKILDSSNNEINSYSYSNNTVGANEVNTSFVISKNIVPGIYKLQTIYNGKVIGESSLDLSAGANVIAGSGTPSNPYQITNADQLRMIELEPTKVFKLMNDIDLSASTREGGQYYNSGQGWDPISGFAGTLDGNGKTIVGLYSDRTESTGLFESFDNGAVIIKNITLKDFEIKSNANAGALVANIDTDSGVDVINNVAVLGGIITAHNGMAGIVGSINFNGSDLSISNIFNSSLITGVQAGTFGNITANSSANVTISDVQNVGNIIGTVAGGIVGNASLNNNGSKIISNLINTGSINYVNFNDSYIPAYGALIGVLESSSTITVVNGYYINDLAAIANDKNVNQTNVVKKIIQELKDSAAYENWTNVATNYTFATIDNVSRIPILSFVDFEYTKVEDFVIPEGVEVNIRDNISPKINAANQITYTLYGNEFVELSDGKLKGLKAGEFNIHILSKYDGYDADVAIEVVPNGSYTIIYDGNGAEGNMESEIIYSQVSKALKINQFVKTGYNFVEWNTKADGSGTSYSDGQTILDIASDGETITLYAIWKASKYRVNYDANGGIGSMGYQTLTYDKTSTLLMNKYTKEGYRFKEWNTKSDGSGTNYQDKQKVSNLSSNGEAVTLYAIWEVNYYTINYDANGGEGTVPTQKQILDENFTILTNPFTRKGYSFVEWNTESDGSGTGYSAGKETSNIGSSGETVTLYAIWKPIEYTIRFNANGGEGTMEAQTLLYDTQQTLSPNAFTDEYNWFLEWNTEPDGSGVGYEDEEQVVNLVSGSETLILYAIWVPNVRIDTGFLYHEGIVFLIPPNSTVKYYLNNIYRDTEGVELKVADINGNILGPNDIVTTRSKLLVYKDGEVIQTYYNAVQGDVNCNGTVTLADVSKVFSYIMKITFINDRVILSAGDVSSRTSPIPEITMSDVAKTYAYFMGLISDL